MIVFVELYSFYNQPQMFLWFGLCGPTLVSVPLCLNRFSRTVQRLFQGNRVQAVGYDRRFSKHTMIQVFNNEERDGNTTQIPEDNTSLTIDRVGGGLGAKWSKEGETGRWQGSQRHKFFGYGMEK